MPGGFQVHEAVLIKKNKWHTNIQSIDIIANHVACQVGSDKIMVSCGLSRDYAWSLFIKMTSTNGNIFPVTGLFFVGNSPVTGEFPTQMPVTRGFDVFFYVCLNEQLSKQSWGWWFETPLCSLWRQCNDHELDADAYMVDRHWPITFLGHWPWLSIVWTDSHTLGGVWGTTGVQNFDLWKGVFIFITLYVTRIVFVLAL